MLGFPIVALALLTLQNERNALLETVALIGLAIFVVAVAAFAVGLAKDGLHAAGSAISPPGSPAGAST